MNGHSIENAATMTHSFIVKIWVEETGEEAGRAMWRGHITHVLSGKRRYLQELNSVTDFIAPYIEHMGGKPSFSWRIRQWFRRRNPFAIRSH